METEEQAASGKNRPCAGPRAGRAFCRARSARAARSSARLELAGPQTFQPGRRETWRFRLPGGGRDIPRWCNSEPRGFAFTTSRTPRRESRCPCRTSLPSAPRICRHRWRGRRMQNSWLPRGAAGGRSCTVSICRRGRWREHSAISRTCPGNWRGRESGKYSAAAAAGKKASLRIWAAPGRRGCHFGISSGRTRRPRLHRAPDLRSGIWGRRRVCRIRQHGVQSRWKIAGERGADSRRMG